MSAKKHAQKWMNAMAYGGAITALVTPMIYGGVDEFGLKSLINFQLEAGIDGLVPCGTTGETSTLSFAEQVDVVSRTVQQVDGKVPVIAGAGSNNTAEAVELSQAVEEAGADVILSVSPYYNRPSQEGIIQHFSAIARSVNIPIILYDVPSRTSSRLELTTIVELANRHANIVGIKEASGNLKKISEINVAFWDKFMLFSGDDFTALSTVAIGGRGVISVVSNIIPTEISQMIFLAREGSFADAKIIHDWSLPLMEMMFGYPSPAPAKRALKLLDVIQVDELRLPMTSVDVDFSEKLIEIMTLLKLL